MRSLLALCLGLALGAPGRAQSGPGVLWVDAEGHWDSLQQGDVPVPGGIGDFRQLLRPEAIKKLSFEQRNQLLREPQRLLSSSHARDIFAVPRVLLLEPDREGRVGGLYVDLEQGVQQRLVAEPDKRDEEARKQLVEWASQPFGPRSVAVVANQDSQLYHTPEATHTAQDAPRKPFESNYLAEREGFRPCPVCFDQGVRVASLDQFEMQLGEVLSRQVESEFRLSQDPAQFDRVQRVGRRLVEGNTIDHNYRFVVLDSDHINAFAVPTGPLYITTGLLRVVESDDELAGILGHELAHSELHHGRRQYEQSRQLSWLSLLAAVATGQAWVYSATQMFGSILTRGYSRDFELEADRQGLWYAYGAGYHPEHFRFTLQKFLDLEKKRGGPSGFSWLRTHPAHEHRLEELGGILQRLQPWAQVAEALNAQDPGLAAHLRRRASQYLEDPQEVEQFFAAYRLLSLPQRSPAGSDGN